MPIIVQFFYFSDTNYDNEKTVHIGTKISLAKGPNKDLLR